MRRWLLILLSVVFLTGLSLICIPAAQRLETYQTNAPEWTARLTRPDYLRMGEEARLTLDLRPPQSLSASIQSVRTRLELDGLVQGNPEAGEAVQPGGSAYFSWSLRADVPVNQQGRLWIYAGEPPVLLNVRPVRIETRGPSLPWLWALRLGLAAAFLISAWFALRLKPLHGRAPKDS
jgi:hypothetical protein